VDYITVAYALYLAISVALTVWVARSLSKNGWAFLLDSFRGDADLARSVNELLVVGFYLVNLGLVLLLLRSGTDPASPRDVLEATSAKVGVVLLVLGTMHFANLLVLARVRRRHTAATAPAAR
jgi:hypothetical protein